MSQKWRGNTKLATLKFFCDKDTLQHKDIVQQRDTLQQEHLIGYEHSNSSLRSS